MKKVLQFLKREFLEMLPPTIFFMVAFHIVVYIRFLMIDKYVITFTASLFATVNALVIGKSILVADSLPLFRLLSKKRIIYMMTLKIIVYSAIVLLFQFLEEFVPAVSKFGSVPEALNHIAAEIQWPRFWAFHIIYILFLLPYLLGTTIMSEIGKDHFLNLFFGREPDSTKNN
ncbi:MAG: hypothetical protein WCO02_15630 [Bacteroidota bacterium]